MLNAPLDDSSGLCDLIQSDNISISTLLSIVVMAEVSIGLSATFKIWIWCDGSIKFRLNITSYFAVNYNRHCHLCKICMSGYTNN